MNASEPQPGVPAQYVMATKWVIEGLLLPTVGSVGVVGNHASYLSFLDTRKHLVNCGHDLFLAKLVEVLLWGHLEIISSKKLSKL